MAKAKPSRTINPLHFEHLEPRRFEDLVRQLAYDFRPWSSLEALGRSGADEGMDILGLERIYPSDSDANVPEDPVQLRRWIIQCKREKEIGPKKLVQYIAESLEGKTNTYGFALAAACDFSKKARDDFRRAVASYGCEEAHLWGAAELEDMLYLPKNDHLLFAYFGLSIQVRRQSRRTELNNRIVLKRKLKELIPLRQTSYREVLLRDPEASEYPFITDLAEFRKRPQWQYFRPNGHYPPDHLQFLAYQAPGWIDWSTGEWDISSARPLMPVNDQLYGLPRDMWDIEKAELNSLVEAVPEERRVNISVYTCVSYDRILAVDEIGDAYNAGPHLLVVYDERWGFFERGMYVVSARRAPGYDEESLDISKQIEFSPRKKRSGAA